MNIFILYNTATGEFYCPPYRGDAEEWTNIPEGCSVLGPIAQQDAPLDVLDALSHPELYLVKEGVVVKTPTAESVLLDQARATKIAELDRRCEETILAGFTSTATGHTYSFDQYDQMNFTQKALQLQRKTEEISVVWKTEDSGPIEHTRDQFFALCDEAEGHKTSNITKYWELKAQVEAVTTAEEVDAIQW